MRDAIGSSLHRVPKGFTLGFLTPSKESLRLALQKYNQWNIKSFFTTKCCEVASLPNVRRPSCSISKFCNYWFMLIHPLLKRDMF